MSPDNSLLVACGDAVVVAAMQNTAAASDVVAAVGVEATDNVVVVVGVVAAVVVWVQQCWMRPCTNPQSHMVSVVVTLRGKKPSCTSTCDQFCHVSFTFVEKSRVNYAFLQFFKEAPTFVDVSTPDRRYSDGTVFC